MKQFLGIAGLIIGVIQGVVELIKSFEVTPGFGSEKKALVTQMAEKIFEFLKTELKIDLAYEKIAGTISWAIDAAVGFFNMVGFFKKKEG